MSSIEAQLRRYADGVESSCGPPDVAVGSLIDQLGAPGDNGSNPMDVFVAEPPRRRRWAPGTLLAAAAGLLIGGLATTVLVGSDDRQTIAVEPGTDDATVSDGSDTTVDPATGSVVGPGRDREQAGLIVPGTDGWVAVDYHVTGEFASSPSTDVAVFARGEQFFILLSNDRVGAEQPLSGAAVGQQHNRLMVTWSDEDRWMSLHGFNVDDVEFRQLAQVLEWTDAGGWSMAGFETILSENGGMAPQAEGGYQLALVPVVEGVPDLSGGSVSQSAVPASPGELFRVLHEAADLGMVVQTDIAGADAYVMGDAGFAYAFAYVDGALVRWSAPPEVELVPLLRSYAAVERQDWLRYVGAAEENRGIAQDALAVNIEVEAIGGVPRLLLPFPWRLTDVRDPTLWSDDERRRLQAEIDAMNLAGGGREIAYLTAWQQLYARPGTDKRIPEIAVLLTTDNAGHPPATTTIGPSEPYSVGTYEGYISEASSGSLVSVRAGEVLLEISAPSLTAGELDVFVQTLVPAEDGSSGFDSSSTEFVPVFEPVTDPAALRGGGDAGWRAEWRFDGETVSVALTGGGSEAAVARRVHSSRMHSGEGSMVRVVDQYTVFDRSGRRSEGRVEWYSAELDAMIEVSVQSGADRALELARSLRQVGENQWVEAVGDLNPVPTVDG